MKKTFTAFIALLLIITGFTGCNKFANDMLIGRWKLVQVEITTNSQEWDSIDYSNENIIYDFQKNSRLVISGNIPDDFYVFKDFQAGKHSFKWYTYDDCPSCTPPMFFQIDRNRSYNCCKWLDEENDDKIAILYVEEGVFFWRQTFVKI
jgi:hypothetical protein